MVSTVAFGDHYHSYSYISHGLVHGESTIDGSFFGRTEHFYLSKNYSCAVGDTRRGYYYGTTVYNNTCSLWSRNYSAYPDECAGAAYNEVTPGSLSGHRHLAHNYQSGGCQIS